MNLLTCTKKTDLVFFCKILLKNIYAKVLLFVFNSLNGTYKCKYIVKSALKACVVNELKLVTLHKIISNWKNKKIILYKFISLTFEDMIYIN